MASVLPGKNWGDCALWIWVNGPSKTIRRRGKVLRTLPDMAAAWHFLRAPCPEQHEEWFAGKRYITEKTFFRWKVNLSPISLPLTMKPELPKGASTSCSMGAALPDLRDMYQSEGRALQSEVPGISNRIS